MEEYLKSIGVNDPAKANAALQSLGLNAPADLESLDMDGPFEAELRDGLKDAGISLGDRGKILKACKDKVAAAKHAKAAPGGAERPVLAAPSLAFTEPLPTDVKKLRALVKAVDCPDEGMRGTAADILKLRVVQEPSILMELVKNLAGRVQEAGTAAAVLRSIAITPTAVTTLCGTPVGVVAALVQAASTRPIGVKLWALPALGRLAQYREVHSQILGAGGKELFIALSRAPRDPQVPNARLDLVATMAIAHLSESAGQSLASQAPLRAVRDLVTLLRQRLGKDAAQTVSERLFCGLPLDFRPRFVCQALACLAQHSAAHAGMMWSTDLPQLLCGILDGALPNDTAQNAPWGSPDLLEMSRVCAHAMLALPSSDEDGDVGEENARASLSKAAGPPPGSSTAPEGSSGEESKESPIVASLREAQSRL